MYRLVTRDTYEMHLYSTANQKLGLEQALIKHGDYHMPSATEEEAGGKAAAAEAAGSGGLPSSLKTAEIERLLRHGAQKLFTDEHDEQVGLIGI